MAASMFGGGLPGSRRSRCLPNHYQFPLPSERLVTSDEGTRFLVDIGTLLGWYVRFGLRDPSLEKFFALLCPGMTVVDVGANIGFTALTAAGRVGGSGRVIAFEPHSANFEALQKNVELNPDLTVEAFNIGLANSAGEAKMIEPLARNPGGFRISSAARGNTVSLESLDGFLERDGSAPVDVLKIDTEGFEFEVLCGATGVLRESQPAIFIELSEGNLLEQGSSTAEILSLLSDFGYDVREAASGERLGVRANYEDRHFDAIALAPSRQVCR